MSFLIFLAAAATAYFAWRIVDQLPDIVYRLSEIQRDLAELRRQGGEPAVSEAPEAPEPEPKAPEPKAPKAPKAPRAPRAPRAPKAPKAPEVQKPEAPKSKGSE